MHNCTDCFIHAVAALTPMKGTVALLGTSIVRFGICKGNKTLRKVIPVVLIKLQSIKYE